MGVVRRVFRRSFDHVDRYALAWSHHNARARAADGPLWVVLGDSAAQGVGASAHDRGYDVEVDQRRGCAGNSTWIASSRGGAATGRPA